MSRLSRRRSRSASMMTGTVGSSVTASKSRFLNRISSFSAVRYAGGDSRFSSRSRRTVESSFLRVNGLVM